MSKLDELEDLQKRLHARTRDRIQFIQRHKTELLEAWIAKTGLDPNEACLVQQDTGTTTTFWVERKSDFCSTHRDEIVSLRARVNELEQELVESANDECSHEFRSDYCKHCGIRWRESK